MVWSNGYLITRYGDVYEFDFDFASLEEDYRDWRSPREISSLLQLPSAYYLVLDEKGSNEKLLPLSRELPPAWFWKM